MSRPLPAAVYWRRRLLLLGVLLLASWGVVQVWPTGGAAETPARPAVSPADDETQDPAQDRGPTAGPQMAEESDESARQTTVSVAAGGRPCDPESIRISPQVPPDQASGAPVRIQLGLSTSAEEPCTFTADAGDVVALVSARGQAVWDSDVCRGTTLLDGSVALSPGWVTVAEATWSGRGSGPICSDDEDWASPGKYRLRIGTFGGEPGSTTFRLAAPEKEEPEPSDDEEPEPSDDNEESPEES
ncbi:hypothetical protein GCM10009821_13580 [Aeromicrobium halocynthiae]|uniref:DUF4232 domain-containing protein n=1 Tax=Aeromicrobium halocynthiae TaxID=560557 RepID=A0ABN2VXI4_9ACTN